MRQSSAVDKDNGTTRDGGPPVLCNKIPVPCRKKTRYSRCHHHLGSGFSISRGSEDVRRPWFRTSESTSTYRPTASTKPCADTSAPPPWNTWSSSGCPSQGSAPTATCPVGHRPTSRMPQSGMATLVNFLPGSAKPSWTQRRTVTRHMTGMSTNRGWLGQRTGQTPAKLLRKRSGNRAAVTQPDPSGWWRRERRALTPKKNGKT
jgi:hypothetical protein